MGTFTALRVAVRNAIAHAALLLMACLVSHSQAGEVSVITWNVESGGADPAVIAEQLEGLPTVEAYLLQEMAAKDIGRYAAAIRRAHGKSFKYYLSSLGGGDRLAIVVDESKVSIRSFAELFSFNEHVLNDWRHRSPLVAHLVDKSDGAEFLLVTVHLARGNARLRNDQAAGLREWASSKTLPVILAGDCNFDYDIRTKKGNEAHEAFLERDVWQIVPPKTWIDSNWSDGNGDGRDDYPDSVVDFAAVCSHGETLEATCRVIVRPEDFPDTAATSDHRPLKLSVDIPH